MELCEKKKSFEADEQSEPRSPSLHLEARQLEEQLKRLALAALARESQGTASKEEEDDASSAVSSLSSKEEKKRKSAYPIRPGEPDCTFYMRTGMCRFGSNCKFNHPPRRKNQVGKEKESEEEGKKEKVKEKSNEEGEDGDVDSDKEEFIGKDGQQECKYYLKAGGCKYGKACRYHHSREKSGMGEPVDFNFLNLPLRPGEKECPFYMRTGSCKFGTNCRFHHPDPDPADAGSRPAYQNDRSLPLHTSVASSPRPTSWPLQRNSNEPVPYMEALPPSYLPVMLSPPPGLHPSPEWNVYIGPTSPLFSPERHMSAQPPSGTINFSRISEGHQFQTTVEEYPERPGQRECQYYMRNGDCKFKSACRFHHPQIRVMKSPSCALSPMGLPLRPDQIACTHFSRYGICKFGPACKFDHPMDFNPASSPPTSSSGKPIYEDIREPASENGTEIPH